MAAIKLHGLRVSYYTGKMEAYLRYKGIEHEFVVLNRERFRMLQEKTGASQMPAIELPDGRFMTDTTPMIAWFEEQYPDNPVSPADPVLRFVDQLIEDYAEEWLWRPAMHYRWSYKTSRLHLGRKITEEMLTDVPGPGFLKRAMIRRRQWNEFVKKDGVDANTWDHVESIYLDNLDRLEQVFAHRPYLWGERPTLADFGYFASMFRHFAQDPTASDIMRRRAPGVFAWQARLWNERAKPDRTLVDTLPDDLKPILADIGGAYLPYLNANARAWQLRRDNFDPVVQGVSYRKVPVSQYRVWCLEELQRKARQLSQADQGKLSALLNACGCWGPLFELEAPDSRYDDSNVPFHGRKVHYDNAR